LNISIDELLRRIRSDYDDDFHNEISQRIADYTKLPLDDVKHIIDATLSLVYYRGCHDADKQVTYQTVLSEAMNYPLDDFRWIKKQLDFYVILRGDVGDGTFFEE
jgi:hypothetical protein